MVDALRDPDDLVFATLEVLRQLGLRVGFLLEDKGGEEGDDFIGLEAMINCQRCEEMDKGALQFLRREHVLQDQFCQDKFVGGMDFTSDLALQLYP